MIFLILWLGGLIEPINSIVGFINGGITNLENTINGLFGLFGEEGVDEEEKQYFLESQKASSVPQIPKIPLFKPKRGKGKRKNKSKVCLVVVSPTLIHTMVVVLSLVVLVRPSQVWDLTLN